MLGSALQTWQDPLVSWPCGPRQHTLWAFPECPLGLPRCIQCINADAWWATSRLGTFLVTGAGVLRDQTGTAYHAPSPSTQPTPSLSVQMPGLALVSLLNEVVSPWFKTQDQRLEHATP